MMNELVYTLVGDGPSDRRLIFPINWLLSRHTARPFRAQWADTRGYVRLREGLQPRVSVALELFPCDILFIHRDSEAPDHTPRVREIEEAVEGIIPPHVKVVPVRMQEAWFLCDEAAIRKAAGKPSGRRRIEIPSPRNVEEIPDPKQVLHALIREASEKTGRHLRRLSVEEASSRVAELTLDYSHLRETPAFQRLETGIVKAVEYLDNVQR
jgi:hypothetical protein